MTTYALVHLRRLSPTRMARADYSQIAPRVGQFELIQFQIPDISHLSPYGGGGGGGVDIDIGALRVLIDAPAAHMQTNIENGAHADLMLIDLLSLSRNCCFGTSSFLVSDHLLKMINP